ncbi:MAG: helix-turn-helix transcriptional regulator [Pseudodesulfovibrio sp.]|nr:helix-turn-helix transcriptional regulator [Pseudodesulfovibrio sp.]
MIKQQQTSEALSNVLLQLYDMPKEADFFEQVLHLMEGHVPFQVSGYSIIDIRAKELDMKLLRNQGGSIVPNLSELEKHVLSHPLRDVCYENSKGPVVGTIDLLPEKEWKKTPLYNEVHKQLGLVHDTSMRFYRGFRCVSFAFCDTKPLAQNYYNFLNLIAPHLAPARTTFKLQRKGLLDHLPENVVMISKNNHLKGLSPSAAALFNKYYPTRKRDIQQLPDNVWRWFRHETNKGVAGQPLVVRLAESLLSLSLLRTPRGYLIVLNESVVEGPRNMLLRMGLTKRESDVILWVSQGKQNAEVANLLRISAGTVRKHMEHILSKLKCKTRGAASEIVLRKLSERSSKVFPL